MKLLRKHIIKFLIVIVLFSIPLKAQTKIDSSASKDTVKFVMQKSATGAMLRSAVLPGWGQFYNESYWKIPVIWGFLGYFLYEAVHWNNLTKDYSSLADNTNDPYWHPQYIKNRDISRDNRDSFFVYMALVYLVNIVDSYVDAHLFDFDVSETVNKKNYSLRIKIGL